MSTKGFHIEKRGPTLTVGVCKACNKRFKSHIQLRDQAEWEITVLFQRHKCKSLTEVSKPIARLA